MEVIIVRKGPWATAVAFVQLIRDDDLTYRCPSTPASLARFGAWSSPQLLAGAPLCTKKGTEVQATWARVYHLLCSCHLWAMCEITLSPALV